MNDIILVTGASSGIGRRTAIALARQRRRLVLVARREDRLHAVARACRDAGSPEVLVSVGDVSSADDVDDAVDQAVARFGRLDVVVHAAAVAAYGRFVDIPGAVFDRVQDVNLKGTGNVARSAIAVFRAQGHGHLVLLGSVVGKISVPLLSPYVTSKWGVHGLARTLQGELSGTGIEVSLVEPGGVQTSIYEKAASYLGVQGAPPPPVASAEKVGDAIARLVDRPRRERSVGLLNPVMTLGFRLLPGVYDLLVGPLVKRLALADRPVVDHPGNVFEPTPEPDAGAGAPVRSVAR